MDKLIIPRPLYMNIMDTIGKAEAEAGGVFAIRGNTVCKFYFDSDAGTGGKYYRPTADKISETVNEWLKDPSLKFGGYIHSHPLGFYNLSPMDILAAKMSCHLNNLPYIYMAIVCDNEKWLSLYKVHASKAGEVREKVERCIVEIDYCNYAKV